MKSKTLTVVAVLMGLGMIVFGANKLIPFMPTPELSAEMMAIFSAFGTIKWLMPLVGIAEIFGGILIAIPKTRALGAIILFPIVVGFVVHHLVHDPAGIAPGAIFAFINCWVIVDSKHQYMPMIK
jgi:putative oxidoreductase